MDGAWLKFEVTPVLSSVYPLFKFKTQSLQGIYACATSSYNHHFKDSLFSSFSPHINSIFKFVYILSFKLDISSRYFYILYIDSYSVSMKLRRIKRSINCTLLLGLLNKRNIYPPSLYFFLIYHSLCNLVILLSIPVFWNFNSHPFYFFVNTIMPPSSHHQISTFYLLLSLCSNCLYYFNVLI